MVDTTIEELRSRIARRLKMDLESRKGSAKVIADLCDISEQAVSKWKKTGQVSLDNLVRAASVFGRDPSYYIAPDSSIAKESTVRATPVRQEVAELAEKLADLAPHAFEAAKTLINSLHMTHRLAKDSLAYWLITAPTDEEDPDVKAHYARIRENMERLKSEAERATGGK